MSGSQSLKEAIQEYMCYTDHTKSLFRQTSTCFQKILDSIDVPSEAEDSPTEIPFSQLDDVERELQKSPSVFFIGESNCGKSSIINELLRQSSLPVNETPCTARIVRIKYAERPYITLRGSDGNAIETEHLFKKNRLPEQLIVVSDQDRENENALNATVEVGLSNELLKSGIELVDSPGKSESEVLDKVLDEFLKRGTVPLFVYVINGCNNLRTADLQTLKFLKDKFPQSPVMYVCNKVDRCKWASSHDSRPDDEDDGPSECDNDGDDRSHDDGKRGAVQRVRKEEKVFCQLKEKELLSDDCWERCSLYHAISAKVVREERRSKNYTEATARFTRFESALKQLLGDVMKTQTRRVVQKLLVLQESFVNVVQVQRTLITQQACVLPDIIKKGYEVEKQMFESLSELTFASERSKMKIVANIMTLKEGFMLEADMYEAANLRDLRREAQAIIKNDLAHLENELPSLNDRDLVLERFLLDMKGNILEKTCNSLAFCVEEAMKDLVNDLTRAIIDFNENLAHPMVSRILEESYDIQFLAVRAETDELLQMVLNGLLDSIKEAASMALRKKISEPISSWPLSINSKKDSDVRNRATRISIMESLLKAIDEQGVAEAVHEACFCRLQKMHELFAVAMNSLQALQANFANCHIASRLEKFRLDFTPQIRTLAVEGMALQNMQNRGPVRLGSKIAETRLGAIYECTSESWCKAVPNGQCVVKVLKKERLREDVWKQTAVDLVNMMDMIQRLGGSHRNLLRLFGWVLHEPGVLHVVMERAERGVLQALREGLPEIIRMNIAVDVAEGLKAIHDIDYTYEDLKPDNVLLMHDGTAKINLAKPEFPYRETELGEPFHISPEMYQYHGKGNLSYPSYDIYAFGMLLWVLCEGSGCTRPRVYKSLSRNEMREAVEKGLLPERIPGLTDACWGLLMMCWKQREEVSMDLVLTKMKGVQRSCRQRMGLH